MIFTNLASRCLIEIENTLYTISSLTNMNSNDIGSLRQELIKMLDNQNSFLVSEEISYGEFKISDYTAVLNVSVSLKEYTENSQVYLEINDDEILMTKSGSAFKAEVPISIFSDLNSKIIIKDSGYIQTQELNYLLECQMMKSCLNFLRAFRKSNSINQRKNILQ